MDRLADAVTAHSKTTSTPPSGPLLSGLDVSAFQHHYTEAVQDRKKRVGQIFFNTWYYYVAPILIGMIPGKFYADILHPTTADDMVTWWIPTLLSQLIITPLLMRYRRLHKGYKRHQIFYTTALEACLKEEAARAH